MEIGPLMHLVVFGYGYTGKALASAAAQSGVRVSVMTRQPIDQPVGSITFVSFEQPPPGTTTHIVATAPPGADGDPVLRHHGTAIRALRDLRWIGYISTTGVYGDRLGGWVDESSEPTPSTERGRRRVEAERAWSSVHPATAVDWFRLAGIYGPGRSVFDDLRAGRARRVVKPGHVFGRIHRDDIVGALLAAMQQDRPPGVRVLNGADNEPAASADVIAEGAALLDMPMPPTVLFELAVQSMGEMGRSFWSDSRRVDSAQSQRLLARKWRYPTYREGLRAILASEHCDESGLSSA